MSSLYVAEYVRLAGELVTADELGNDAEVERIADRLDDIYRHLSPGELSKVEAALAEKNGEKERKESAT